MAFREITLGKSLCLKTFWSLFWCVTGWREGRKKKMRTSWCGWGRCLIFLKVEMYPSHPPFCHNRLVFFILSNRFFPLKSWRRGGGKCPFGPQDKLIEKCWHQMKGGLLTWWVGFLPLASAACWDHVSVRLSQGLLISRPWDEAWGTPSGQTRAPPQKKNHLHPPNPPQLLHSPEPIVGMDRLGVQGSEKIKCMEYKGLNWIAFSLLLGEGSLGG